jgi:hypothetical protein
MSTKRHFARNLAAAFLSGTWSAEELRRRGALACGRRERWLGPLIRRLLAAFEAPPPSLALEALTSFIDADVGFCRAWLRHSDEPEPCFRRIIWIPPTMAPVAGAAALWSVPPLPTSTALATWLGLRPAELDWFADCPGHEATVPAGPLRHYTYRWLSKAANKWRLLEMPKPRLKALQRRILRDILDHIPPHAAVHGYRPGCSIATFAAPHCGHRLVLRFDLRHFFPSVRRSRVHAVFATAGYPLEVARLLTGLCTNVVPEDAWPTLPGAGGRAVSWQERQRYRCPHLPQGAPTSPALANLCAYRLDCRLHGLAGAVGAAYTRYADDLAFSGDAELERSARRFQVEVARIALEEGFEVHTRKSRFMRQGVRQQLVGVVVNAHPNVLRRDYDCLKAILHNCIRHGPASQNRQGHTDFRGHLLGRIAHVAMLNAARGRRLRSLFERVRW